MGPLHAARAQTAGPLSKEDVSALLASKAVDIAFPNGATLSMTNATSGSLSALLWHASPESTKAVKTAAGTGSWKIAEDGHYCVKAGWRIGSNLSQVDSCRTVTPSGDSSYILKADGEPDWTMRLKN
jgi:hypothetical protein